MLLLLLLAACAPDPPTDTDVVDTGRVDDADGEAYSPADDLPTDPGSNFDLPDVEDCPVHDDPPRSVPVAECRERFFDYTLTEKWRYGVGYGSMEQADTATVYFQSQAQLDDDNGDGRIGLGDTPDLLVAGGGSARDPETRELVWSKSGGFVLDGGTGEELHHWPGFFYDARLAVVRPDGPTPTRVSHETERIGVPDVPRADYEVYSEQTWVQDAREASYRAVDLPYPATHPYLRGNPTDDHAFGDATGDGLADVVGVFRWHSDTGDWFLAPGEALGFPHQGVPSEWGNRIYHWGTPFLLDLDGDAPAEFLAGRRIYADDGSLHCAADGPDSLSWPADFDGDGETEVALMNTEGLQIVQSDCSEVARFDFGASADRSYFWFSMLGVGKYLPQPGAQLLGVMWSDSREGRRHHLVVLDGNLGVHIVSSFEPWSTYFSLYNNSCDLDGDGLFEVWQFSASETGVDDPELVDPRTGDILATLPPKRRTTSFHGRDVIGCWDVDGDIQAEVVVWERWQEPDGSGSEDLVVYEGQGFGPAPRVWHASMLDRAGYMYEDGTYAKAGEYPPFKYYNSVAVPEYAEEWEGYGANLETTFTHVCRSECGWGRLKTWVEVANTGEIDLERPLAVELVVERDGIEEVVDYAHLHDGLASGQTSGSLALTVPEDAWSVTDLRVRVVAQDDRSLDVCNHPAEVRLEEPLCE